MAFFRSIAEAEALEKKRKAPSGLSKGQIKMGKILMAGAMKINRPPMAGKFMKLADSAAVPLEKMAGM